MPGPAKMIGLGIVIFCGVFHASHIILHTEETDGKKDTCYPLLNARIRGVRG